VKFVFADTFYLIALINPKDQWHERAVQATESNSGFGLVTTESILVDYSTSFRNLAKKPVEALLRKPSE